MSIANEWVYDDLTLSSLINRKYSRCSRKTFECLSLSFQGIVVLFGRAMDKWLLASKAETLFRPAPHSVPALKANKKRVIFARMYVAPKEALPIKGNR
jgi:hypothetical protein